MVEKQPNRGTGFQPVRSAKKATVLPPPHGQDAHATSGTGILPVKKKNDRGEDGSPPHGQDGRATVGIRQGAYLPHWTRDGGFYAVVFRLCDSLPAHVVAEWKAERERILNKPTLSPADERRLYRLFSERVEKFLDAGQGSCWMRQPTIADVVAKALTHFDHDRYRLLAWCVMPNHVHVVVRPNGGHELQRILHSWKSFTASQANELLRRSGAFWQPEYYDHLIRDEDDLFHAVEYTLNNPVAAGLRPWRWVGCAPDIMTLLDEPVRGTGFQPVENDKGAALPAPTPHGQDAHATPGGTGILPMKDMSTLPVNQHNHDAPGHGKQSSSNAASRSNTEGLGYGE